MHVCKLSMALEKPCNTSSNYTHSHLRNQFHTDTSMGIGGLEVVNKLDKTQK